MKKILLLSLGILACLNSCSEQETESVIELEPRVDISFTRAESEIGGGANEFSFKLLNQMCNKNENCFFSPLSVHMALSMLCNGSSGETYAEMIDKLGFKNLDLEVLNSYNQKILENFPALDKTVSVHIANGFWAKDMLPIQDSYKSQIGKIYHANISNIDNLHSSSTIDKINAWCDENTNHMIPSLVDPDEDFDALIANALCFEGSWRHGFNKKDTKTEKFYNENGSSTDVKMMNKTEVYGICYDQGLSVIEIPYGNESFSMYIIMPNDESENISEAIADLDNTSWSRIKEHQRLKEVKLSLPKFEMENKIDLIPILTSMGFGKTLSEEADFAYLCKVPLVVSKAFQKNYFVLDEKGAKAASVTAIELDLMAVPGVEPTTPEFKVNRPFAFLISEKSTSSILFAGIIKEM